MKSILNKNGNISAYGFACGYVQRHKKHTEISIYAEHGIYIVTGFIDNNHIRQCFEKLTEALKYFKSL